MNVINFAQIQKENVMANVERRQGLQCPKGHPMDPNWNRCPYCKGEAQSKKKTPRQEAAAASSGDRQTRVGKVPPQAGGRQTRQMSNEPSQDSRSAYGEGETRRIVGVLITYSWRPEGELFPVREGKNFIGSGKVYSDASHRECHIQIPVDKRMSSEHSLILCRHGIYEIMDQMSSNGTFLNGDMLRSNQSKELEDQAEVKTGDTLWSFFKIKPPEQIAIKPVTPKGSDDTPTSDPGDTEGTIVE